MSGCYYLCTELTLFLVELFENCIYLNQSELSNFFTYIIIKEPKKTCYSRSERSTRLRLVLLLTSLVSLKIWSIVLVEVPARIISSLRRNQTVEMEDSYLNMLHNDPQPEYNYCSRYQNIHQNQSRNNSWLYLFPNKLYNLMQTTIQKLYERKKETKPMCSHPGFLHLREVVSNFRESGDRSKNSTFF